MKTGAQRTVGWWKTVEGNHGTHLGVSAQKSVISRRRRNPPLYGRDIRIFHRKMHREDSVSCECMKLFIKKSGTAEVESFVSYRNVEMRDFLFYT